MHTRIGRMPAQTIHEQAPAAIYRAIVPIFATGMDLAHAPMARQPAATRFIPCRVKLADATCAAYRSRAGRIFTGGRRRGLRFFPSETAAAESRAGVTAPVASAATTQVSANPVAGDGLCPMSVSCDIAAEERLRRQQARECLQIADQPVLRRFSISAGTGDQVSGVPCQGRYCRLPLTSRNVARLHSSRVIVAYLRGPSSRHLASSCCSRNSASTRRMHASVALDILRSGFAAMPAPAARNIRTRFGCTIDGRININWSSGTTRGQCFFRQGRPRCRFRCRCLDRACRGGDRPEAVEQTHLSGRTELKKPRSVCPPDRGILRQ